MSDHELTVSVKTTIWDETFASNRINTIWWKPCKMARVYRKFSSKHTLKVTFTDKIRMTRLIDGDAKKAVQSIG